jgi:LmbE family N-acetylglucosaminyl deacetylase
MSRSAIAALVFVLCAAGPASAQQIAPPGTGGIAALSRALDRLGQNRRVLVIGAHPDDEDTELLAFLSRGLGADAAYLSLSRGEGGQNLIGPELGAALGLVRTGELLAARSVDGARQYFTRGFDFGFSKTLDETLRFWPRDSLLADIVRVIRRFRPQVLVSVFSGTPRDGHGQHQESGILANAAFALLRDSVWGPRKLYRAARFDTAGTTITLASGSLDPVTGKSYHQLAMAGRSLHRSQDMGQIQGLGASVTRLALVESGVRTARTESGVRTARTDDGGADQLFAGVDTALAPGLARYAALIDSARGALTPRDPSRVLRFLVDAMAELRRAGPSAFRAAKEALLAEAIAAAAGVVVDAYAGEGPLVAGQGLSVTATVWGAGAVPVQLVRVTLAAPRGWNVADQSGAPTGDGVPAVFAVQPGSLVNRRFTLTVPADAALTEPYFLARPRIGALYDWAGAPEELRGEAVDPPLVTARFALTVSGTALVVEREVAYRHNDQASGEVRTPLVVAPAVGVSVSPDLLVWPLGAAAARAVTVELTHAARGVTSGMLRLEMPAGWPEVPPQPFALEGPDAHGSFTFLVRAPSGLAAGSATIRAVAESEGRRFDRAVVPVDYAHIRPAQYVTAAVVRVEAMPLVLPQLARVGYVRGAADGVPEALQAVGVPVRVLSAADLERGDLSQYDLVIVGSRAYETDPALVANNGRLLDYARGGGRLIVQYQQYQFITGRFAPFPLSIARPHDRVTDETAPVTILAPSDPLFRAPNAIGDADWQGWVQERGLYFAHDWGAAYTPLLEMGDAGERLRGGLLVAPLGRGLYVYTGLSFFRQLPAGVPGAYRLFANLLARRAGGAGNDVP